MKKTLSIILSLVMVLSALPLTGITAFAAKTIDYITAEDMTIEDGTHGYYSTESYYDDDLGAWVNSEEYFYYSLRPIITVYYTDGSTFTGDLWEVEEETGLDSWYSSGQSYEDKWTAGNTYEVTAYVDGYDTTFNVTITESRIASISIKDVEYKPSDAWLNNDWIGFDEDGNDIYSEDYLYYSVDPEITVTYKDGTTFTGDQWDVQSELDVEVYCDYNQSYDNQWTEGNTYTVTVYVGMLSETYNVSILENPIKSISVKNVTVKENTNGWVNHWDWNHETEEDIYVESGYFEYYVDPEITVNYKDGTTFTGNKWEVEEETGYWCYAQYDQSSQNQWIAGNRYPVTAKVGNFETTYYVTIQARPASTRNWAYDNIDANNIEITGYLGSAKELTIPAKLEGYTVESATVNDKNELEKVTIENGVTNIAYNAFYGDSSLKDVSIPDSVTSIGPSAFYDCTALKSITIPQSVKSINSYALGYYQPKVSEEEEGIYVPSQKVQGFTIYGYTGSAAERYAKENGFNFKSIGEVEVKKFPDVPQGEWFANAISFNVQMGYFHGYQNGTFGPSNNIQRQDFVVVLANIAGADLSSYQGKNGNMPDVPKNDYYSAAVAWAVDNHIINGYSNGKFGVGDPITREQVCVIFYNYFKNYLGEDVSVPVDESVYLKGKFADGNNVSGWAVTAVTWSVLSGVISGTNGGKTVSPAGNANRAQIAQIIYNMSNNGMI